MLAFPSMLFKACEEAGIPHPENPNDYSNDEYPHFLVFTLLQLGIPMEPGDQFYNAIVLSAFTREQIRNATPAHFYVAGFSNQDWDTTSFNSEFLESAVRDVKRWAEHWSDIEWYEDAAGTPRVSHEKAHDIAARSYSQAPSADS